MYGLYLWNRLELDAHIFTQSGYWGLDVPFGGLINFGLGGSIFGAKNYVAIYILPYHLNLLILHLFLRSYFLPDKQRQTKQKSPLASGSDEIQFDHLFSYTNVNLEDLQNRCLELTVWHHGKIGSKMGSNTFVGGVRLSMGPGKFRCIHI